MTIVTCLVTIKVNVLLLVFLLLPVQVARPEFPSLKGIWLCQIFLFFAIPTDSSVHAHESRFRACTQPQTACIFPSIFDPGYVVH
jgi:hypothetical protein